MLSPIFVNKLLSHGETRCAWVSISNYIFSRQLEIIKPILSSVHFFTASVVHKTIRIIICLLTNELSPQPSRLLWFMGCSVIWEGIEHTYGCAHRNVALISVADNMLIMICGWHTTSALIQLNDQCQFILEKNFLDDFHGSCREIWHECKNIIINIINW